MSFFQKLKAGLSKTKEGMLKNLDGLFGGHKIEEEFYEELEEILIMSDVGASVSD
ncbi:MAG TPA: signal recognition particle-docking protein FtsY, partial [Ruminococcaceae bacterium]|nr:signal recognition particle-docking protein FtsY [Oscillospiraceae bacterium]